MKKTTPPEKADFVQNLPIYQVDAFSEDLFGGNPAAVIPVPEFPDDRLMQRIAAENNLSETAFVIIQGKNKFAIRWFTPTTEVRLCGHATLAAAHVLNTASEGQLKKLKFITNTAGTINVVPKDDDQYSMSFPTDTPKKIRAPKGLAGIMGGMRWKEVWQGEDDLLVVVRNQQQVESVTPNFPMLAALKKYRGMIVTASGDEHDFVSRCFFPACGIDEDPVTGSAHTLLTPFWAEKLGKKRLRARQLSARGGELQCEMRGKRVHLIGKAITYMTGQLILE